MLLEALDFSLCCCSALQTRSVLLEGSRILTGEERHIQLNAVLTYLDRAKRTLCERAQARGTTAKLSVPEISLSHSRWMHRPG